MSKSKKSKSVSDTQTVESVTTAVRSKIVPFAEFATKFVNCCKQGKTPAEAATIIGMSEKTLAQRCVGLRKMYRDAGRPVTSLYLKTHRGRTANPEQRLSILDQLLAENV